MQPMRRVANRVRIPTRLVRQNKPFALERILLTGRLVMTQTSPIECAPAVRARLLVVDDEATARRALGLLLSEEGYEVDVAASGEEALEKLSKAPASAW